MITTAENSEQGYRRRVGELMEKTPLTLTQARAITDYEYNQRNWGTYNYYAPTYALGEKP